MPFRAAIISLREHVLRARGASERRHCPGCRTCIDGPQIRGPLFRPRKRSKWLMQWLLRHFNLEKCKTQRHLIQCRDSYSPSYFKSAGLASIIHCDGITPKEKGRDQRHIISSLSSYARGPREKESHMHPDVKSLSDMPSTATMHSPPGLSKAMQIHAYAPLLYVSLRRSL